MWSEGQWEASEKTAPDGAYGHTDRQTDKQATNRRLLNQLGENKIKKINTQNN